ncbi:hypothetical protein Poli38472_001678 [Pythium oligandrum]|uniref:Kelch repeat protein n=1 Tax=Pythium oligandrum TaxID=41045 RepID=A0A8K1CV89_PYTOL|nr:hypothetical protein Poli38472_001678 [Pythium oligandrum]|eukprot:TMW69522.1 hypothetical protein Poli38472_001678 [Pythium oligandrum]
MTPWTRRHGHAVTALDFSDDYVRKTGQKARMFVIGGDSSVQGKEDLRAYPGGGSLKNDVWATTGIHWEVQTNILKTTKWGDPLPQTIANITWLQTNNGKRPPRGVTYHDWIACAANAWAVMPVTGCDDPTQPPGAYLADNMFSPRRNFVAMAFQNELYVLGGRAREHFPIPEDQLRGGVASIGPRNVRWREFTVLKNDVWRSSDAGASWKLVTPGCLMPQADLIHKASTKQFQCVTDDDCEGDSSCKFDQATSTGLCVCNMWSPREYHAVTLHDDAFYLSGGYALIQLGNCGVEENMRKRPSGEEFACGGGYRAYLNDVWTSKDGQTWSLVTLHAAFTPRGEHAMVSFQGLLYIFGGRSGDPLDVANRALHNDVWVSSNAKVWTQLTEHAPWSPRAKHVVLILPGSTDITSGDDPDDELLLLYGEDEERALEDVWTWRGGQANWTLDYSDGTDAADYVAINSDVRFLRTMTDDHAQILNDNGINTLQDLTAGISFDLTITLRALMPICDYIALAKEIISTCTVSAGRYEGEEYAHLQIVNGKVTDLNVATTSPDPDTGTDWDGCAHIGTQVRDSKTKRLRWVDVKGIDQVPVLRDIFDDAQASICQWHPTPRTGHSSVVFQRKVFTLGGLTAPDYFENDVWYRDKRRPKAQFTLVPTTGTSQTVFRFESDKIGCTFEYHVLNIVEMLVVRNWTKTLGEVDFISWLDGGKYRFRVRALDPAGNVDMDFELHRNEHIWVYKPKLPWALIIGLSCVGFVLLLGFFLEWRKRRKRAAMERYAMKRMRRKLKGSKKGEANVDANWRETYDDAKDASGKKKKGKVVGVKKEDGKKSKKDKSKSKDKDKKNDKDKKAKKDKEKKSKKDKPSKDKASSKKKDTKKDSKAADKKEKKTPKGSSSKKKTK